MSQLTIKLSDKADALIAQLQKEIFNRRRKKVSPAGVVETLVESGAKSQSDKRFATSWKNLVTDIEKAAKEANAHGVKPAGISDAEWALILSHRSRTSAQAANKPKLTRKAPAVKQPTTAKAKPSAAKASTAETTAKTAKAAASAQPKTTRTRAAAKPKVSKPSKTSTAARPSSRRSSAAGGSSVAKRMAKAVSRLNASGVAATSAAPTSNGNGAVALV